MEDVNRDAAIAETKRLNDIKLKEEAKQKRKEEIKARLQAERDNPDLKIAKLRESRGGAPLAKK